MNAVFPSYVRSVVASASPLAWPVSGQGFNECSFTSIANALNLLNGAPRYRKEEFIREAGLFFQPRLGGTLPFLKASQLRRRGYGAHFGNLSHTNAEAVLRDLIDRGVPTIVDIYPAFQLGRLRIFGQHATVLVGYSEPFHDAAGTLHEEYYLLDAQWPALGAFDLAFNDVDRNGDGQAELFPGNRTLSRTEFMQLWTSRNYCPIFHSPADHQAWYATTIRREPGLPMIGRVIQAIIGSDDRFAQE
ncbi:MAG TPA: hypothetical protein PKA05_10325 [Roseiflexaceae bacterium]|nr:hypothetical protein [Roseiflexaceae bacterium]